MLENTSMATQVSKKMGEMEGFCRTPGISSIKKTKNIRGIRTVPDPEVRERAVRLRFTAEYKLRIQPMAFSWHFHDTFHPLYHNYLSRKEGHKEHSQPLRKRWGIGGRAPKKVIKKSTSI